jgi:alkanesulfonate monooxygenase SsuD/methylene tetrahydromethanopterin reductase-like flavin-dependent oxidoreductase (luciferase family)
MSLPFQHPDGTSPSSAEVIDRAKLIEDIGFEGIWFGESIGRTANARPDPLIWLAIAAAGTSTIELGTAILQVPLRYPVEFAQRLMTLHALSGGRFRAGLGAGPPRRFRCRRCGLRFALQGLRRGSEDDQATVERRAGRRGQPSALA